MAYPPAAVVPDMHDLSPLSKDELVTLDIINSMIEKYAYEPTGRKLLAGAHRKVTKERVVITGTTGALGAYVLASLLESDAVEMVWTLNRKSKEGISARQRATFDDKALDVSLLDCGKLKMLEADLEAENLGLNYSAFQEVSVDIFCASRASVDKHLDTNECYCNHSCT